MSDDEIEDMELDALISGGLFVITLAFAVVGAIFWIT